MKCVLSGLGLAVYLLCGAVSCATWDGSGASGQAGNAPGAGAGAGRAEGVASWYGAEFHGRATANGETYDMHGHTAAHRTLPFNTVVRVIHLRTGASTVVRINDRGPFVKDRIIDLSMGAARDLDMVRTGTAPVRLEVVRGGDPPATYRIQVGAFENAGNARRLAGRLRGAGFTVVEEQAGTVTRVVIPGLDERSAAATQQRLRQLGLPAGQRQVER